MFMKVQASTQIRCKLFSLGCFILLCMLDNTCGVLGAVVLEVLVATDFVTFTSTGSISSETGWLKLNSSSEK